MEHCTVLPKSPIMKRIASCLFMASALVPAHTFAQQIEIGFPYVKENKIEIPYTLTGRFYQTFNVSVLVSLDSGKNFKGPLQNVTGDVGPGISRGSHAIIWDAPSEFPFLSADVQFWVKADPQGSKPKRSLYLCYVGNTSTYLGLRFGMLGMVGVYGEFRMNSHAFNKGSYTYKDGHVDYTKVGYYRFTDKNHYSSLSVLGGISVQPAKDFFLYLGLGYGKENFFMKIDEYSYSSDQKTGSAFVKYDGYCTSGFESDLGCMIKIKKVLLSAGATTIRFKKFNATVGIGIVFN